MEAESATICALLLDCNVVLLLVWFSYCWSGCATAMVICVNYWLQVGCLR